MATFKADVLICGAGAAGLSLAIDLARRGVSFLHIEKREGPFHGSRGKGIQPRSQEVFEDLGIIDRLAAIGTAYPVLREYQTDGTFTDTRVIADQGPTPAEPYHTPLMVAQYLTEGVLRERLAELGHVPQFGCELIGFEQDDEGVSVRVVSQGQVRGLRVRYLIGTDGGRSDVRNALNIGFPGKTLGVRAVVADVSLRGLERDLWHSFNKGLMPKMLAICPLAGTDLFQLQAPIPLDGDADLSAKGLSHMIAERTGRDDIVVDSVSWASAYSMNARLAEHYRVGRVFLAGDAAHIHPPTGGQGLNTSVQDAYNLGWKLAAVLKGAPLSLLDTYEEERKPVAAHMLGLSSKLLDAAKQGSMQRGREVQQLDLGYAQSSLALATGARTGLRAGDRAPDAPVRGAAGQVVRLFQLFQGPHWTLIGYEVERDTVVAPRADLHIHIVGEHGDIIDDSGYLRAHYGVDAGDWVLVRPDGYVGAIVSSAHISVLSAYLQRVGLG
ncbi:FAD-dependent oxidoreductase [Pseudomonas helleri]|uniref:FAD-dependent oxidoreductase n=1 Tax=Pseudomonas helleri TaxID=1608996 RepID=UPI00380FAA27